MPSSGFRLEAEDQGAKVPRCQRATVPECTAPRRAGAWQQCAPGSDLSAVSYAPVLKRPAQAGRRAAHGAARWRIIRPERTFFHAAKRERGSVLLACAHAQGATVPSARHHDGRAHGSSALRKRPLSRVIRASTKTASAGESARSSRSCAVADHQAGADVFPRGEAGARERAAGVRAQGATVPECQGCQLPRGARGAQDVEATRYERNMKYTAPTRHRPAHRKSSLSGCFM